MLPKRPVEVLVVVFFLIFSIWLMSKSFGYEGGEFRIARHQVGDFGLHLSLIRSFSWGNNWPVESPFYPGKPLPYHYGTDLFVGLLERSGIRLDYAVNGVSVFSFTILLYLIYRLSNILFGENPFRALLSVAFFLLSSNLSIVDFLKNRVLSLSLLTEAWRLPEYLYKGPFDGSIISIFSSLNPLLNQRHLIVELTLSLLILSSLIEKLLQRKTPGIVPLIILGAILGVSTRIHSLVAASTVIIATLLLLLFSRAKFVLLFAGSAFLFAFPHLRVLMERGEASLTVVFQPGFLAPQPISFPSWLSYWWQNVGLVLVFLPIGLFFAKREQRKVFLSFFALFIIANMLQLSYRMEHNYSIITLFMIIANIFVGHSIFVLWKGNIAAKIATFLSIFFLTASGLLNLVVVKNDFQYKVADLPKNQLIEWIKTSTPIDSIFLARQDLYDPVTLAGRKNYLGASYYNEVMGYDIAGRNRMVRQFFETSTSDTLPLMRSEGIDYVTVPNGPVDNFPYTVDRSFFQSNLESVYVDNDVIVYRL